MSTQTSTPDSSPDGFLPSRTSRRGLLAAMAGLGVAALTGCTGGRDSHNSSDGRMISGAPATTAQPSAPEPTSPPQPVGVTLAADGASADQPLSPRPVLRPTVTGGPPQGVAVTVVVTGANGAAVPGTGAEDGSWTPAEPLELGASYTAVATAIAEAANASDSGPQVARQAATAQLPFTVTGEDGAVRAKMMPLDGEVVGVGMPVVVILTTEVPQAERQALVDAITLDVTAPTGAPVEGAWRWIGADRVHWRPKEYWPSGTKVRVQVPLTGMQVDGRWGAADRDIAFTVGDSHIATADTDTHEMTVRVNGEVAKVIPISAGREDSDPAFVTRSGVHLVLEKHEDYLMDGRTVGQDYATQVKWATRIANSGEFVHGAPWSVPSQGKRNVSHGCLNVSDANAKWFYGIAQRGDVVHVTGTDRPMELTNGLGDWVLSWEQWTAPQRG